MDRLGINRDMAGRGGRISGRGFNDLMATALGAPGIGSMGFIERVAGRGGRTHCSGFIPNLATAFDVTRPAGIQWATPFFLAGRGGRNALQGITL